MPSHKIHIGIGQEVVKSLRCDKDLFLLGCILPDLGENHFISHFKKNHREYDIPSFLMNCYNSDDPVMMGYLVHLLTDKIYNDYVRDNRFVFNEEHLLNGIKTNDGIFYGTPKEVSEKKQEGFYDYEYYLVNKGIIDKLRMVDLNDLTNIDECNYDKDYIKEYIDRHDSDIKKKYDEPKYDIFTFEELDNLYKKTIIMATNFIKNINKVEKRRKLYYNYNVDREKK